MSLGSLIIACSPGYASIGLGAPALLVLARLMQGLSVGGEYGASATYLSEMATPERRGFYSSFQYVTLIAGQLVALGVQIVLQLTLTEQQLYDWGWRIPFFIGAACAIVAYFIRRHLDETTAFKNSKRPTHYWRELFKHPKAIATVIGLTLGGTVAFYTYSIYMQKFMVNTVGLSKQDATMVSAVTLFPVLLPAAGGRHPVGSLWPPSVPDRLRRPRHPAYGAHADRAQRNAQRVGRVRAHHGRAGGGQRLHLDQCHRQSRIVSRRDSRARRRPALRHRQFIVRRHPRNTSRCGSNRPGTNRGFTGT